ncbi:NAD(P)-dependent oxidoreductase [Leifsonia sp. AG29]|uniref:NAD(P)-dependent oxidoreductase n=1 Tax=Leifsonia sp. AG29 TaxID=2598860 RepID=UPI00131E93DF|nr:NAD(P)-dependent oxidoreductase [Leifsonia sp. AG29]
MNMVAILGLGRMGEPIARRLLDELGSLTVWNRTAAKATALVELGADWAATPSEAAAPITLTVLTDLGDVEAVLDGENGLLAGWRRAGVQHPVLVVHGTVSPTELVRLEARLRDEGVLLVDAPLSGGVAGAESGGLSVMVGGSPDAVAAAMPVLRLVGSTVVVLGGPGAGELAKACNQIVVATTIAAISESLALADANGIDRTQLLDVLGGGLAASEVLRQKRERWVTSDYQGGGSADNQLKDLRFVEAVSADHDLDLPVSRAVTEQFERMVAAGLGELDHSALELTLRRAEAEELPA